METLQKLTASIAHTTVQEPTLSRTYSKAQFPTVQIVQMEY